MPIQKRRFLRIKEVLNRRIDNLTLVLESVEKPHNLSAILRTCDAVGIFEIHSISKTNEIQTFNSTAQGSQKWVRNKTHSNIVDTISELKSKGFLILGTSINKYSKDYRSIDLTGKTAFILGTEKWGLSQQALNLIDIPISIPMRGMVQSLNVSVAAATLLFEAIRQREVKGLLPKKGEGIKEELINQIIFEWAYPEIASWCKKIGREYPELNDDGEILEELPC
mgnify:CR=1 FL=1